MAGIDVSSVCGKGLGLSDASSTDRGEKREARTSLLLSSYAVTHRLDWLSQLVHRNRQLSSASVLVDLITLTRTQRCSNLRSAGVTGQLPVLSEFFCVALDIFFVNLMPRCSLVFFQFLWLCRDVVITFAQPASRTTLIYIWKAPNRNKKRSTKNNIRSDSELRAKTRGFSSFNSTVRWKRSSCIMCTINSVKPISPGLSFLVVPNGP